MDAETMIREVGEQAAQLIADSSVATASANKVNYKKHCEYLLSKQRNLSLMQEYNNVSNHLQLLKDQNQQLTKDNERLWRLIESNYEC